MTRTRWSPKARLPDYLKIRGPFWPSLDPGPWSLALSKIPIQGKILILGDNQCNNKTAVMFSFAIFTPIVPGPSESVSSGAKKLPRNQNKIKKSKRPNQTTDTEKIHQISSKDFLQSKRKIVPMVPKVEVITHYNILGRSFWLPWLHYREAVNGRWCVLNLTASNLSLEEAIYRTQWL